MRSTLLFVAVLLACTPVHGQTTGPVEAPILNAWLAAILPAPVLESGERAVVKRRRPASRPSAKIAENEWRADRHGSEPMILTASADLLLHSPNAP